MDYDLKVLISTLNVACKQALEDGASECVKRGHFNIEIEHILLSLLGRRTLDLPILLKHYGVDPEGVAKELEQSLSSFRVGNERVPTFSAHLSKLFREAWLVASLQLGEHRIRSGALLLALRTTEGVRDLVAHSAPSFRRIEVEALRRDLADLITETAEAVGAAPVAQRVGASASAPKHIANHTPNLDLYTVDLTAKARAQKIDPIIGRDHEIRQLIDILSRRRQNNPILTGEAGVGKTAVVEGLAQRIASGDVPPSLRMVSLRSLDLALLQAGAGIKGEFEARIKAVIDEVKYAIHPVVLFIDEAHSLIGAGGAEGQGDAANLLKPALARGELRTVAATTWAEYKRYFEADSALARRFQVVRVEEPTPEVAVAMLRGLVVNLERHHGVRILDEAVQDAVALSRRYITERRLPDKAVGVLDTAAARVAVGQRSTPAAVEVHRRARERIETEIAQLEREQGAFGDHRVRLAALMGALDDTERACAELEDRWRAERGVVERIRVLEDELLDRCPDPGAVRRRLGTEMEKLRLLQGDLPMVPLNVDVRVVADVVSDWTGVPVGKMLTDEANAVLHLTDALEGHIVGQTDALDAIVRRIKTSRALLDDPDKPVGVFLLAGPSGVGKTETAHALADVLYGGSDNLVAVNMSEFQEPHSVASLRGAPPGYVGYGRGGVLTEAVRRRPHTVVLLDEIEKAHSDVLELFYQVFDKGTMDDGEGVSVDFRNTVILLTSNLGAAEVLAACARGVDAEGLLRAIGPALNARFAPALLARMVVVPYRPLDMVSLHRIVGLKLARVSARFEQNHGASLSFHPSVVESIALRCTTGGTGARTIDQRLSHELLPALSDIVLDTLVAEVEVPSTRGLVDPEERFVFLPEDEGDAQAEAWAPALEANRRHQRETLERGRAERKMLAPATTPAALDAVGDDALVVAGARDGLVRRMLLGLMRVFSGGQRPH